MDISRTDVALRVNERIVFVDYLASCVEHDHRDFDDSVMIEESCRLDIHDGDSIDPIKQLPYAVATHSAPRVPPIATTVR
jgi:hypothetical protein